jgi:hypothetical protein
MAATITVGTYGNYGGHVGVYEHDEQQGGAYVDECAHVRLIVNDRTYIIDTEDGSILEEAYALTDKGRQAISR